MRCDPCHGRSTCMNVNFWFQDKFSDSLILVGSKTHVMVQCICIEVTTKPSFNIVIERGRFKGFYLIWAWWLS